MPVIGPAALDRRALYGAVRVARRGLAVVKRRRVVSDLDELDALLADAEAAAHRSHDEWLSVLGSFEFRSPAVGGDDALGEAYSAAQRSFHATLAGQGYSTELELDPTGGADPGELVQQRSDERVRHDLATLVGEVGDVASLRITELGVGDGGFSVALAESGAVVTAVDIDPDRAARLSSHPVSGPGELVGVVHDMASYVPSESQDLIVFRASFHHTFDFASMLAALRASLRPGGRIVLLGEPIGWYSQPWGVRLDGLSLWCVRRHGWCELGFSVPFFSQLAHTRGFVPERVEPLRGMASGMWTLTPN